MNEIKQSDLMRAARKCLDLATIKNEAGYKTIDYLALDVAKVIAFLTLINPDYEFADDFLVDYDMNYSKIMKYHADNFSKYERFVDLQIETINAENNELVSRGSLEINSLMKKINAFIDLVGELTKEIDYSPMINEIKGLMKNIASAEAENKSEE